MQGLGPDGIRGKPAALHPLSWPHEDGVFPLTSDRDQSESP